VLAKSPSATGVKTLKLSMWRNATERSSDKRATDDHREKDQCRWQKLFTPDPVTEGSLIPAGAWNLLIPERQ
jgi:hypothetical protein